MIFFVIYFFHFVKVILREFYLHEVSNFDVILDIINLLPSDCVSFIYYFIKIKKEQGVIYVVYVSMACLNHRMIYTRVVDIRFLFVETELILCTRVCVWRYYVRENDNNLLFALLLFCLEIVIRFEIFYIKTGYDL